MDAPVSIARNAAPSVAFLRTHIPAKHPTAAILGDERLGSGVAVDHQSVLTAHYLVMGAAEIELRGGDGRARPVESVTLDHDTGLALLRTGGPPLSPVAATEGPVTPGLPVFLLSSTDEGPCKGASGHVSAVMPFEAFWEYMLDRAILTTLVNPGLAGSPLFDSYGRLVGLVSLGLAAVGRYSLAIPAELYRDHRDDLESGQPASARAPHAWVGFFPQVHDGGLVVTGVVPDGPADRAGVARGDFIVSVDGQGVVTLRELYVALRRHAPGEHVRLQLLRDGGLRACEVRAGDRYEFYK
jgi:serine protease DegS